ncbi:MAG: hypothetical protein ACK44Q_19850, partial [Pirellulaceae bacterium]
WPAGAIGAKVAEVSNPSAAQLHRFVRFIVGSPSLIPLAGPHVASSVTTSASRKSTARRTA